MIVGEEQIGDTAARVLANIERNGPDELIEVDEVMVIVVVSYGEDEDSATGSLWYACTSARHHVQRGILVHANEAVTQNVISDDDA